MDSEIDTRLLAEELRQKRGKRGLRAVADEIGNVSASTLSRIEQGKVPDLDTFVRICRWLDVPPDRFIIRSRQNVGTQVDSKRGESDEQTLQTITVPVHLKADRTLSPKTLKALEQIVRLAFDAVER